MNKKSVKVFAILVVIVVVAVLFARGRKTDSDELAQIKRGTIVDAVYGIGTLTAVRSLSIKSGVTSGIQKTYVNEGDVVKKGQLLFLLEGGSEFRAPFAGVVSNVSQKEGETVFTQTPIMTLTDRSTFYLSVSVEQQGALKIKNGMPVRISFDGMRDKNFLGKVEAVYANGADFVSRISVRDLPDNFLSGMTADVAIVLREKENALLVPVAAIDSGKIKIKINNQVTTEAVSTGLVDGAFAEITSGNVKEGDLAILSGKVGTQ